MSLDVKLLKATVSLAKVQDPGKTTKLHVLIQADQPYVARSLIAELDQQGKIIKWDPSTKEPDVYLPLMTSLAKFLDSVFEESGQNFLKMIQEDLHGTGKPEPEKGGWSH